MKKLRPSKSFIFAMLGLCPLLIGAGYVLNRNSQSMRSNGENSFARKKHSVPETALSKSRDSRTKRATRNNSDQRREAWFQEILLRHPDMAIPSKNVPDDQNGFLKWLDFAERFKKTGTSDGLEFPKELSDYMSSRGAWNPEVARAWLAQHKPLLDEIRAIGLMPDQSSHGIKIERYGFFTARIANSCVDALVIDARLAAADGNAASALETMRAANGLGDHFNQIETPSFLTETITTLIRLKVQNFALAEIMQALPADAIDIATWEATLHHTASSPAEFGRILKGEWNVDMQRFILPILSDTEDLNTPPDPEAFIDVYTEMFRRVINANSSMNPKDLSFFTVPPLPSSAGLSKESRNLYDMEILQDNQAWRKSWTRAQSVSALTQAAFAIMKNQPIPQDPVYGQDYRWDPSTRQLSMPSGNDFDAMDIKPITVPKL